MALILRLVFKRGDKETGEHCAAKTGEAVRLDSEKRRSSVYKQKPVSIGTLSALFNVLEVD